MNESIQRARSLRRNQTDAERRIWSSLRSRRFAGYKFRRQVPLGNYIADFVCFERSLIVELDGGQHNTALARDYDARRTAWFESRGFRVVRVWNHEVFEDADAVEELLWRRLQETFGDVSDTPPHP